MIKRVKFQEMLACLRRSLEAVPEHRTGRNTQYEIVDAGLGCPGRIFPSVKQPVDILISHTTSHGSRNALRPTPRSWY